MKFKIIVSKDESGFYVVECVNLPGCISQGKTEAEAMKNIRDAINGYLKSLKKHNEEIPVKDVLQISEISV
ncbi:MAG: type II toxin-antitoxin system HicB family antitoxin [Candidatus Aenigmarchaeota archaeon]|nr:type II toxin-antitoxin system HicB family antitoxin [Candidatus Aenigmarchaeota archaeon]